MDTYPEHGMTEELPARIPEAERRQVIELFNATEADYPKEKTIHQLFEEQVDRAPHAVAVVYEGHSLSYAELNVRANQLAWHLKDQGVQVGEYVPVCMQRSLTMLIAQLAVLKVGGIYVPLDPELPSGRRDFMIRDCGACRIITDSNTPPPLKFEHIQRIDTTLAAHRSTRDARNLDLQMTPAPAAYVMYTSGSTGEPKGVVVPHHAVIRLVINNGYAQISSTDCLVHYSNPAFDASTFEIFGALLNGARLIIVPQALVLEGRQLADVLKKERASILWMSVGLFNRYTDVLADVFAQLRYLIIGGDVLDPQAVRRVLEGSPPEFMLNAYGPTECTTFSTTHLIKELDTEATSIPIGRPISNAQVYILGAGSEPVSIGTVGELYIGGAGVGLGYLNRPDLTAERFLPDPFCADPQARMYKTGDLGRWRADGTIEFIGRNDNQVKVRGFRIELGEIEAQLTQHPGVREAAVLARGDEPGEKRLIAYVVGNRPGLTNAESAFRREFISKLRTHLRDRLPDYMVPSAYVVLKEMPLTPNGKLDRRALPPPRGRPDEMGEYMAPRSDLERRLTDIWMEVLGVEHVGVHDNFFELGGNSLLGMKLLVGISQTFAVSPPLLMVLKFPTVEKMAQFIEILPLAGRPSSEPPQCEEGVL